MAKSVKKSYRVLHGMHVENDVLYGKNQPAGDIVQSASDLLKFNSPGAEKFALLGVGEDDSEESLLARKAEIDAKLEKLKTKKEAPASDTVDSVPATDGGEEAGQGDDLDEMSFVELKELAESLEIQVNGLKSKEELRVAIRKHRSE